MTDPRAFLADVAKALEDNAFGVAGAVRSQEGGAVFVDKSEVPRPRLVPHAELARLAAAHAAAPDAAAKNALVECACRAYVGGAADVPNEWEAAKTRLLPQLWPLEKVKAKQATLPPGVVLPHCGLHGEADASVYDVAVVLVCDFAPETNVKGAPSLETCVLSRDVAAWGSDCGDWTNALRVSLSNLRDRTKRREALETFSARWEHHASGCGSTTWRDRYDAARCALLPSVVARRKREDGRPEPGAHVCVFAARGCALAATSKNALGLCYLGDVVHTKIGPTGDGLSRRAYRLVKVKMPGTRGAAASHPLVQKAGEAMTWKWLAYAPSPSSGEFSVPTNASQIDELLKCLEEGRACPVFGPTEDERKDAARMAAFEGVKAQGNAAFASGKWLDAIQAYDRAIQIVADAAADQRPMFVEQPRPLAAAHANAALCFLRLEAEMDDEKKKKNLAAEALRRALAAAEADAHYAKAHDRCAKAFELLGEPAAAAESKNLYQKCKAADDAVEAAVRAKVNDHRAAAQAAKKAKLENRARREEAAAKKAGDARRAAAAAKKKPTKPAPPPLGPKTNTTITVDNDALVNLGIFADSAPTAPAGSPSFGGGLDLNSILGTSGGGFDSSTLTTNFGGSGVGLNFA